jgi:hypothetical protein
MAVLNLRSSWQWLCKVLPSGTPCSLVQTYWFGGMLVYFYQTTLHHIPEGGTLQMETFKAMFDNWCATKFLPEGKKCILIAETVHCRWLYQYTFLQKLQHPFTGNNHTTGGTGPYLNTVCVLPVFPIQCREIVNHLYTSWILDPRGPCLVNTNLYSVLPKNKICQELKTANNRRKNINVTYSIFHTFQILSNTDEGS